MGPAQQWQGADPGGGGGGGGVKALGNQGKQHSAAQALGAHVPYARASAK